MLLLCRNIWYYSCSAVTGYTTVHWSDKQADISAFGFAIPSASSNVSTSDGEFLHAFHWTDYIFLAQVSSLHSYFVSVHSCTLNYILLSEHQRQPYWKRKICKFSTCVISLLSSISSCVVTPHSKMNLCLLRRLFSLLQENLSQSFLTCFWSVY